MIIFVLNNVIHYWRLVVKQADICSWHCKWDGIKWFCLTLEQRRAKELWLIKNKNSLVKVTY